MYGELALLTVFYLGNERIVALHKALSATAKHMLALEYLKCACVLYETLSNKSNMRLDHQRGKGQEAQKQCMRV